MPDTYLSGRAAVDELINDQTVALAAGERTLKVYYQLTGDFLDALPDIVPVLVYRLGGVEDSGYDRTERIGVDVYADGTATEEVAEAIRGRLVNDGMPHDLAVGYVDEITVETLPNEVPYPIPGFTQAQGVYRLTSRPL